MLATALCLCAAPPLHAQRQADWSLELTGNAQGIIFQHLTGVPIVQTEKAYMGIDPAAKKIIWTADRSGEEPAEESLTEAAGEKPAGAPPASGGALAPPPSDEAVVPEEAPY